MLYIGKRTRPKKNLMKPIKYNEASGNIFFVIMFSDKKLYLQCENLLVEKFGKIITNFTYNFDKFTDYYEKEFGSGLSKTILILNKKLLRQDLKNLKLFSIEAEKKFSYGTKRRINIDPGFFSYKEVVLASLKGKEFKENAGDNIFYHKVLEFDNGKIKDFFHTFPDYKSTQVKEFFSNVSKIV